MEHPCINCNNNWSGEPVPCSNVCVALESWKSQNINPVKLELEQSN